MSFKEVHGNSYIEGDFSKLDNLVNELSKNAYVDVGILGGEVDTESGLTIAGIGAVHEFGSQAKNIPQRSFIQMPITSKQTEIEKKTGNEMSSQGADIDVEKIMSIMGISCEAAIQEAFETGGFGQWKPIKEETARRKNSEAILIEDGTLRKSITSKVGGV